MKDLNATDVMAPVALTEREAEAVSGGVTIALGRLGGCPGCTSGGYLDVATRFAQVVNPAQAVSAVGLAGG